MERRFELRLEELLEGAVLDPQIPEGRFPLKFLTLFHRPSMHCPPVADLLPQVDDFSA